MPSPPARRRGRPPGGDAGGRERIMAAAAEEFGTHGYDAATVRSIAERAGVDPALVHHHFGSKAELFATVARLPIPVQQLTSLVGSDLGGAGERLVRFVLETWDEPEFQRRGIAAMRGALGNSANSELVSGFVSREILDQVAAVLGGGPPARLRAGLVASQLVGMIVARYLLRIEPMASAAADELAAAYGPTIKRYLTGDLAAEPPEHEPPD